MIGIRKVGIGVGRGGSRSWITRLIPEYKTVYDALPTKPSKDIALLQSAMLAPIVSSGAWAELDWFVCMAGEAEDASRLDWKSLTRTLTDSGAGITWTSLKGLKGGTNSFVNTQFVPATHGAHMTYQRASYGFFANLNPSAADQTELAGLHGVVQATMLYSRFTDGKAYVRTHTNLAYVSVAVADRAGCYIANRAENDKQQYWKNNTKIIDATSAAGDLLANSNIVLLSGGGLTNISVNELSFAFAGGDLTPAQISAITTALQTYNDSVAFFFDE